jgi:hypothetical protein
MVVNVGGKRYEIAGIMWGQLPAWRLVKLDGQPMTQSQFDGLPDQDKCVLARHVQRHIEGLRSASR